MSRRRAGSLRRTSCASLKQSSAVLVAYHRVAIGKMLEAKLAAVKRTLIPVEALGSLNAGYLHVIDDQHSIYAAKPLMRLVDHTYQSWTL